MKPDRRGFLRDLAAGTAGLAVGGARTAAGTFGAPPDRLRAKGRREGAFPFFGAAGRYDVGHYLPKDQGGKFVQEALLGSEADAEVVKAVRAGVLERTYGDPIAWSRFEASSLEKSVWLNRFYYLPPFARLFHLTGDRSFLDDMMRIMSRWIADNPRPAAHSAAGHTWRDMQVAWRAIHLSWCYSLGGSGLRDEEKLTIARSLQEHADVLLAGFGRQPLNEFNHQAHGGLAMLYLGALFPALSGSDSLARTGITILEHHLGHAFHEDGGNVEQMFGYYPFEAHIFRDAYLLCAANGLRPPAGILPALAQMAAYLAAVAQPDGSMPPVNDSFQMPVQPTLETIDALPLPGTARKAAAAVLFPQSQVAVLRDRPSGRWYVLANAARTIGAHAHAGRLALSAWFDGRPVLVDSGCCSYDDPALVNWFRTTRAHNTVIVDGTTDAATSSTALWAPRRTTANRVVGWETGEDHVLCRMHSPVGEPTNAGVAWTRTLVLVRDSFLVVHDCFETAGTHRYELLLHFPPRKARLDSAGQSVNLPGEGAISILPAGPDADDLLTLGSALVSIGGVATPAPAATCSFRRSGTAHSILLLVPGEGGEREIEVRKRAAGTGVELSVSGRRTGEATLLFTARSMRVVRLAGTR